MKRFNTTITVHKTLVHTSSPSLVRFKDIIGEDTRKIILYIISNPHLKIVFKAYLISSGIDFEIITDILNLLEKTDPIKLWSSVIRLQNKYTEIFNSFDTSVSTELIDEANSDVNSLKEAEDSAWYVDKVDSNSSIGTLNSAVRMRDKGFDADTSFLSNSRSSTRITKKD